MMRRTGFGLLMPHIRLKKNLVTVLNQSHVLGGYDENKVVWYFSYQKHITSYLPR